VRLLSLVLCDAHGLARIVPPLSLFCLHFVSVMSAAW
jgi:hypothetical protein